MARTADRNTNSRLIVPAVLVGLLSAVAGFSLWTLMQRPDPVEVLTYLPEPKVISPFELTDQNGQRFSLESLSGQWSLMFFGFTNCPDVCPNTLFELQRVNELLKQNASDGPPRHQVIFVSVDPERDTPEKLLDYVHYFDPEFLGVSGDPDQLASLASQLGIYFQIEEPGQGAAGYDVLHSSAIVLMNPAAELQGAFTAPHSAEKMARDLHIVFD